MTRLAAWICSITVLAALMGCASLARQPELRDAMIAPAELKPQESAVITVKVRDRYGIVKRVEGVVREDPRIKLKLRDDGEAPDVKAGDGVWSLHVDVPFQAAPGEFTLDLTAYNSKGGVVVVRSPEGNEVPLTAACKVVIHAVSE